MAYQSLRTLRTELTDLRLAAADTSLWSIAATINDRARLAINDAIRTYPFGIRAVYNSAKLPSSGATIAIPPSIERIINIEAVNASNGTIIRPSDFNHVPGGATNLLTVHVTRAPTSTYFLRIEHEHATEVLPKNLSLAATLGTSDANPYVQVAVPQKLHQEWEPFGYIELSDAADTKVEVVYYNSIQHDLGFHVGTTGRGQMGTHPNTWTATDSITVSPVVTAPPEAVSVIMAAAEANMYNFWLAHRSLYDQYTALTGLQALDIAELLGIVRTTEDRADRRYKRIKKVPRPVRAKVKVRSDR